MSEYVCETFLKNLQHKCKDFMQIRQIEAFAYLILETRQLALKPEHMKFYVKKGENCAKMIFRVTCPLEWGSNFDSE